MHSSSFISALSGHYGQHGSEISVCVALTGYVNVHATSTAVHQSRHIRFGPTASAVVRFWRRRRRYRRNQRLKFELLCKLHFFGMWVSWIKLCGPVAASAAAGFLSPSLGRSAWSFIGSAEVLGKERVFAVHCFLDP